MLNKTAKKVQYQTIGFGYSGTGQAGQLSYYKPYIKKINPSIVVLVITHNDLENNSPLIDTIRYGYGLECQPFTTLVRQGNAYVFKEPCAEFRQHFIDEKLEPSILDRTIKYLNEQSALYRYVTSIITSYYPYFDFLIPKRKDADTLVRTRLKQLENTPYQKILSHENGLTYAQLDSNFNKEQLTPLFADAVERTDIILAQWAKLAKVDNFKLIALLTHTTSHECKGPTPAQARFTKLLDKHHIKYVEQCDSINKYNKTMADAHFQFDGHWNEQGHAWAAEALLPLIQKIEQQGVND